MNRIVGFIIETDEVKKGDMFSGADVMKPDGSLYHFVCTSAMHDRTVMYATQTKFVKVVFTDSFLKRERERVKLVSKAGIK